MVKNLFIIQVPLLHIGACPKFASIYLLTAERTEPEPASESYRHRIEIDGRPIAIDKIR